MIKFYARVHTIQGEIYRSEVTEAPDVEYEKFQIIAKRFKDMNYFSLIVKYETGSRGEMFFNPQHIVAIEYIKVY